MKKLIKHLLRACHLCFGTGNKELPNGDTKECFACKGKGIL